MLHLDPVHEHIKLKAEILDFCVQLFQLEVPKMYTIVGLLSNS
jgi:hypothetical protein